MKRSTVLKVLFAGTWKVGAVLAASTVPAQGPMVGIDPPVVPSAAYGSPSALSAVWNGKEFFAVWSDRRDPQQSNVFGVHVTSAGSVVDQTSLLVTPGGNPAIAWDGTNYLLVYWETASAVGLTTDLVARRLGPDGKLLDSQRLVLSTAVDSHYRVFWTGSEYAVFWEDQRPEYYPQTLMARLGRDGTVIATNLPVFASSLVNSFSVDMPVGWSGSSFLLAWAGGTGPQAQLLSSQGQKVGNPIPLAPQSHLAEEPKVASDGTNFLVAWSESSTGVKGVRVSPTGQLVDSTPLLLSSTPTAIEAHLTWTGTQYIFDFLGPSIDVSTTQLVRLSAAGVPLDSKPVITAATAELQTRLVPGADRIMLIGPRIGAPAGYWLKPDGTTMDLPPTTLCVGANRQQWPALAWNGTSYLVVWYDDRIVERPQLRGQILDGSGKPPLGDSFLIVESVDLATDPYTEYSAGGRPAVASDGKDFLVAWSESDNSVRGARVSGAGQVIDPGGLSIASGHGEKNPIIVWTGSSYFVLFLSTPADAYGKTYVSGRRVDRNGAGLDQQDIQLGQGPYSDSVSHLAATFGKELFVVWESYITSNGLTAGRFDATGKPLGAGTFSLQRAQYDSQTYPSVAWNGSEYLVAWSQYLDLSDTFPDLVAARIAADGTFRDAANTVIAKKPKQQEGASVVWDGNNYVAVWYDGRDTTDYADRRSAFAARLDASGTLLDPDGIQVSNPGEYGDHPVVATRGGGDALVALQRYDSAADMRAIRAVTRAFSDKALAAQGTPCLDGAACASGFCVDGVCCDTACGNGNGGDCQACSVAAHAAKEGTCGPVAAGTVCRAATTVCDLAEACDGTSRDCPQDAADGGTCGLPEAGAADRARDTAPEAAIAEPVPDAGTVVDASAQPLPDVGAVLDASAESVPDASAVLDASAQPAPDAGAVLDVSARDLPEDRAPDRTAADSSAAPSPAGKSGCGCRLGGTTPDSQGAPVLLLLAAALALRGPRRRTEDPDRVGRVEG